MIITSLASMMTMVLSDAQKLETDISLSNPTRIIFEDDKPTKLIFNQADENAPSITATLGTAGDIFVSVESGLVGQAVAGFVTTESGKTYPVKFKISSMETPQITVASSELREQERKAAAMKVTKAAAVEQTPTFEWNTTNSYTSNLGNMVRALYYHRRPEGFEEVRASKSASFGSDQFRAVPYKVFVSADVEAAVFKVSAINGHSVYLPSQVEEMPGYLALSYSSESVGPEEATYLYIVRRRAVR